MSERPKKIVPWGGGEKGSTTNFITLGQPLMGEKFVTWKEEKKNIPPKSGHYVPLQRPRAAAHAFRSDQNIRARLCLSIFSI